VELKLAVAQDTDHGWLLKATKEIDKFWPPHRSILELSAAAIPYAVVFIAVTATSRMARQANCNPVIINERRKSL
jgi:hypothetical protein